MPNKKTPRDKSKGMKKPAPKAPVPRARPVSAEVEPRADAKLKGGVAQLVRPTTLISTSSAREAAFEVASEGLLSSIRSNFDALRNRLKQAKDEAQGARLTGSKADEDLATALNRLEVGYRELHRGK
jgi:hypothetical protein